MPRYVKAVLQRFNNPIPIRRQDSPFSHTPPHYGAKIQYTKEPDTTELLNEKGKTFIQRVSGTILYLVFAVDITLLTPLSAIAPQQSKPTTTTLKRTLQILDYVATQEEAVLTYSRIQMTLAKHSNAGYLNKPEALSQSRVQFFMSNNTLFPPNNGAMITIAGI